MHRNLASPGSGGEDAVKIKRYSMLIDSSADSTITLQGFFDNKQSCLHVQLASLNHVSGWWQRMQNR